MNGLVATGNVKAQKERCEVGARSETGYVRRENQDRMSGIRLGDRYLYIVADGMGGHKGGALAAELTVRGLQQYLSEALSQLPVDKAISQAFARTNKNVYEKAHSGNPEVDGMGSTAVLLLVADAIAHIAHVGDSRAYLYRKGRLRQLTRDHSRVQRMVDAGMLTSEQARDHPEANLLERAIGQKPDVDVDVAPDLPLEEGDEILLCSDGLCGYVSDREIEAVLRSGAPPQEVSNRLVDLALEKGGYDNITVQFVQYGERGRMQRGNRQFLYLTAAALIALILIAGLSYVVFRTQDQEEQQPAVTGQIVERDEGEVDEDQSGKVPETAPEESKGHSPEASQENEREHLLKIGDLRKVIWP